MDKKLEVKNLRISFRAQGGTVKAVRDLSFDLHQGETLAVVGESGSGKSVMGKAIMGILAGNSVVENGEILYGGQDLLKISEKELQKLRGDRIAMIFQDPMSALNPIMRIGRQLTEAMILKAKAGRRRARAAFNTKLRALQKSMNAACGQTAAFDIDRKIKEFDEFCVTATKLEGAYNEAYGNAMQLDVEVDKCLMIGDRGGKVDKASELKRIRRLLSRSCHPHVVPKDEAYDACMARLTELDKARNVVWGEAVTDALQRVRGMTRTALEREKPNFFTLGYYRMVNSREDLTGMPVADMNRLTRAYLDQNFMLNFIALAEEGVRYAYRRSLDRQKACLVELEKTLDLFRAGNPTEREAKAHIRFLSARVTDAIDPLEIKRESPEYVFPSALNAAVTAYFDGDQAGSEEGRSRVCRVLETLCRYYRDRVEKTDALDAHARVVEMVDFLKEQASRFVVKMNRRIAKAKAVKLMEEVGIPEAATRFRQYPFQFSGGMRQRIVIAIALSANPEILICDEPTTALDVTIQAQILELINDIKVKRNLSVIFITHNMGVVANMADRIAVMYAGKIVEYGTAVELFCEPAHPYTWALLSSMPDLQTTERLESIPGTPPNMMAPPKGDAFAARNRYAMEIDFEEEPPLFEITPTHYAATWLLHPNAPKVGMPPLIRSRIERMRKEGNA